MSIPNHGSRKKIGLYVRHKLLLYEALNGRDLAKAKFDFL